MPGAALQRPATGFHETIDDENASGMGKTWVWRHFSMRRNSPTWILSAAIATVWLSTAVPGGIACDAVQCDDASAVLNDIHVPTYVWQKNGTAPEAIVVGFHGGCLHGRSFETLAHRLAESKIMFVSLDMRGYGKWYHNAFGTDTDKTFNYKHTFEDIYAVMSRLRSAYPKVPVYCIGESLGANVAMVVGHDFPQLTDGVILVSPVEKPRIFFDRHMVANGFQLMLHPKSQLDMTPYLKKRLSHVRQYTEQQIADPLGRDQQTMKELWQSMAINLRGRKFVREISPKIAVLIVGGEKDGLCNQKATMNRMLKDIPSPNKKMVLLPKTGHLIIEAPQVSEKVIGTLTTWIDEQSATKSAQEKEAQPSANGS